MGHEADIHRNIAAALANNLDLRDRFGRPIMEGGGYTVNFLQPPVYTAEKIAPALDRPDLPAGTFRVTLVSRTTLLLVNGVPTEELALCAMPQAMLKAAAADAGESEPPEPPPSPLTLVPDAAPKETPDAP